MNVTFVLPHAGLQGGIRVIAIYAEKLSKRGHKVNLISVPRKVLARERVKAILSGRLPFAAKIEPSHLDGLGLQHAILETNRAVTDADVPDSDVVIATYYTTAEGVLNLSPQKGAKAIFIQNYEVPPGQIKPKLDASWRMQMHKITISKWLVELAREKFGDNDVSHVPNSVDTEQFHAPPRERGSVPTVGFLYNPFILKGMRTTVPSIAKVREAYPNLRVLSFGADLPSFRSPLPPNTVFFHRPAQDKIRDIYAECDVWVCGSNVEGFHLPPLEAMACRCPIVSTKVGGPLDIIQEGVNGHLVDVGDTEGLAARTTRVLQLSKPDWKTMSEAAYATALGFTWDNATDLFEKALHRSIERSASRDVAKLVTA